MAGPLPCDHAEIQSADLFSSPAEADTITFQVLRIAGMFIDGMAGIENTVSTVASVTGDPSGCITTGLGSSRNGVFPQLLQPFL